MYLCQHSQRHSRVQHCKDQGRGRYIWPALTIPLPPSPWWTQGLRLVAPLVEHNHRFATLYTFLWTQSLLCRGWMLPLCTSCSIFHAVFQQSTSLRWTQNMCDAEFHWICICSPNFMAKHYIQVFVEQEHISGKMHHSNWRSGTRAGQWLNLTWSALILIWASGGRPPLNCIMVRRSECPAVIVQCIFYIWCTRTSVICNCMYCVLCEWLSLRCCIRYSVAVELMYRDKHIICNCIMVRMIFLV